MLTAAAAILEADQIFAFDIDQVECRKRDLFNSIALVVLSSCFVLHRTRPTYEGRWNSVSLMCLPRIGRRNSRDAMKIPSICRFSLRPATFALP